MLWFERADFGVTGILGWLEVTKWPETARAGGKDGIVGWESPFSSPWTFGHHFFGLPHSMVAEPRTGDLTADIPREQSPICKQRLSSFCLHLSCCYLLNQCQPHGQTQLQPKGLNQAMNTGGCVSWGASS